ncbi:MAG: hypothetical protein KDJ65_03595 [Anaerolineae bacterium]|nr:hypothetical protein [Anaerolineae bacterium]
MELKQYAQIVWKRVWIPVLLVVVVAVVTLLTAQTAPPSYGMAIRFSVGVTPQADADAYNYDGYYAWVSSEYLADNLTELVSSQEFANDVNSHLEEAGSSIRIPAGMISAETKHRIIRLNMAWDNAEALEAIGPAVSEAMVENSITYFPQSSEASTTITVIDTAGPFLANPPSLRQRLDLPIRLMLALAAGIGLTFLLDYLDDSVRGKAELEAMGITVLAEVPKK